ncbi:hypothetical protein [Burkholderia ubonensis]|uniref:hypothetical protein n=1 Tax=Burkholderia ubonensis TaxID=101571 RepID=UPI000A402653|nr:hypothetical protein [Burkholderia ubonensis]
MRRPQDGQAAQRREQNIQIDQFGPTLNKEMSRQIKMNILYKSVKNPIHAQKDADAIISALDVKGEKPLFRRMLRALSTDAQLDRIVPISVLEDTNNWFDDDGDAPILGDIFVKNDTLIVIQPNRADLGIWFFFGGGAEDVDAFSEIILSVAKELAKGSSTSDSIFIDSPPLPIRALHSFEDADDRPNLKTTNPEYSSQEAITSKLLAKKEIRVATLKLAQNIKIKEIDFGKVASQTVLSEMIGEGLIERQFLVSCKQDSHQIALVDDEIEFRDGTAGAMRCASCNRPFKDEKIETIFTISSYGKGLTDKSRWMSIYVTELLTDFGLEKEFIKWNATVGGDEIDIIADVFGRAIFFELKDREFGQGDAYAFLFRCDRFKANGAVVVSMSSASPEAHSTFKDQKVLENYKIIEGKNEKIERELKEFIISNQIGAMVSHFSRSTAAFAPNFGQLFRMWVKKHMIQPKRSRLDEPQLANSSFPLPAGAGSPVDDQ